MLVSVAEKDSLSEFVRRILVEKGLSTYDVQKASGNRVSAATVTKIMNGDIRSSSIETLSGLAKGLGIPEDQLFRVARGLPADIPNDRREVLAEAFDGQDLTPDDWQQIEGVIEFLVNQRKALRDAAGNKDTPALRSNFKRKKV